MATRQQRDVALYYMRKARRARHAALKPVLTTPDPGPSLPEPELTTPDPGPSLQRPPLTTPA